MRVSSLKPYLFQFIGRGLPQLAGIAISVIITRQAGVDVFGQWALAISLATLCYGVLSSSVRLDFQRSADSSRFKDIFTFHVFSWFFLFPVLASAAIGFDLDSIMIGLMFGGFFCQQLVETISVKYRMRSEDSASILPRVFPVFLFLILLYVFEINNVRDIAKVFLVSWLSSIFFIIKELVVINRPFSIRGVRLSTIAPIWFSTILTQAYGNIDLYIIKYFHDESKVGEFRLSYTFASLIIPIASVFSFIFLSRLADAIRENNSLIAKKLFNHQVLINLCLGVFLIIFNFIGLPFFAEAMYGPVGVSIIMPASLLSIAMMFNVLSMTFSYVFLVLGKERIILMITLASASIYLICSVLLTEKFALVGSAFSMILAHFSALILYIFFFYKSRLSAGFEHI